MTTSPTGGKHFIVTNWFAWIIEAHKAGFSESDILFVLTTVGVLDELRAALAREDSGMQEELPK